VWQSAKSKLKRKYEGSENLQWVLKLLKNFEDTHNTTKYKSDFTAFVRESKLEDFISEQDVILVSTIHQTKGREFDNVFFALSPFFGQISDKDKRAIYVALTRAKTNLHIYTNANYFDKINFANM
jgi:ATP-dependent DNA helicase RecQ